MITGVLYALGTTLGWSLVPFLVRHVLGTLDPVTITTTRLILGGLLFGLIARGVPLKRLWRRPEKRRWLVIGGAALAVNHILFATGLQWTSPAVGVIAVQIQTVAASVLSWIILGEALSLRKSANIAIVIVGIVLVGWDGQSIATLLGSQRTWGTLSMFVAGLFWGVYAVSQRGLSRRRNDSKAEEAVDPRTLLAPFFLIAGALSTPVATVAGELRQPLTPATLLVLGTLTIVGTVGSYYCLSEAMNRLPVSTAVTITNMSPLVVAILSIIVFRESLSAYTLIGGAVAVAGCIGTIRSDMGSVPRAQSVPQTGESPPAPTGNSL